MGRDVQARTFTREDRTRYRDKVRRDLDVFTRMLRESTFAAEAPLTGLEIELNLVDGAGHPAMRNAHVLGEIADPQFVTELGQFNIEINVPPKRLSERGLTAFEDQVRASLNAAEAKAATIGAHLVMIGILPTLVPDHLTYDVLSANPRYALLNDQIFAARGEDIVISIDGIERLRTRCDSIAPEAACTSAQLHLQVAPEEFASYWNAAQAVAGIQVALGANAPFLFGRQLWRETRIPLFEQATDTRAEELKAQGVRPRVWFGERWITSIFDLFEENVRYFPALLPILEDEDPAEVLELGQAPRLPELTLHNGTIYRWNRPVYAVVDGVPHVRVENRVLPAGPTVVDIMANAAFYFGLVRYLARQDRPVWTEMSFNAAEENFHSGARYGIDALMYWPGLGTVPATELVLRRLLPMAAHGLDEWGVDPDERDRLMGVIERRCITARNGSAWQVAASVRRSGSRADALCAMLCDYRELMHSNTPVHEWPEP
ncbi:MAG: glutamate--cysteine ligase [Actinobacteria bacterium 13_1_20CM_3_71_11]|nr:MAG: glutamate--cysteine ligase [Actinobacteria bacterium 13_1_20CM_3_71_11]